MVSSMDRTSSVNDNNNRGKINPYQLQSNVPCQDKGTPIWPRPEESNAALIMADNSLKIQIQIQIVIDLPLIPKQAMLKI